MTTTEPQSAVVLRALRNLIANDSYAMSFQSTGQYRTALLRYFDNLVDAPDTASCTSECPAMQPRASIAMLDGDQQTAAQVAALATSADA